MTLTDSRPGAAAARTANLSPLVGVCLDLLKAEAKERQAAGPKQRKGKKRSGGATSGTTGRARDVAAKAVGVSHGYIDMAMEVQHK